MAKLITTTKGYLVIEELNPGSFYIPSRGEESHRIDNELIAAVTIDDIIEALSVNFSIKISVGTPTHIIRMLARELADSKFGMKFAICTDNIPNNIYGIVKINHRD